MAKKSKEKPVVKLPPAPIQYQYITDTLETNYMPYAMSVILSRAIPEIDGFKPSHRKLLYTMYKMGLLSGSRTKSANVVGQTMKLNPHGDQAIYETMVRLSRGNEALLHPLVDSKGNFGKQYSRDMKFAASRYTEVRLDKICSEIFGDMDKDAVDFVDNYDGTLKEPTLLPATFPNILCNPTAGIAVGLASNICSFNLKEVCDATIAYLNDPDVDMMDYIKGPDFSTGGYYVFDENVLRNVVNTGRGSFRLRAKYNYDKSNSCIEITQIPYTTSVEAIMDTIIDMFKENKVKEINDMRDETDINGLKITIDIKRNADPDALMLKLFKSTALEDTFGCNFNVLVEGKPMVLGVKGIIAEWVRFRMNCVRRVLTHEINRKERQLHLLEGLKKILLDIDKAIAVIRGTEEDSKVVPNLMEAFGIDQLQAEFVADIKLRNLNKKYILDRTADIDDLRKSIDDMTALRGSDRKIRKFIANQLADIAKKYGQPRRTEILYEVEEFQQSQEELIDDYNCHVLLTNDGYFKKVPATSLRGNPEQKVKDGDVIVQEGDYTNRNEILFFTNKQNVYKCKLYDMPESKASMLGNYLSNELNMEPGERPINYVVLNKYEGHMVFVFENGKVSKVPMSAYETKTNRKKLQNAYSDASPLINALYLTEDADMVLFSNISKIMIFNTALVAAKTTKNNQGVQVMTSKKGSVVTKAQLQSIANIGNEKYYRARHIPAVGSFLKNEDRPEEQMTLGDI